MCSGKNPDILRIQCLSTYNKKSVCGHISLRQFYLFESWSVGEEMSQVDASYRATCDPGSQMSTSQKSEEEKPQTGSTECSGDLPTSSTNKFSDDEKSQVATTNKSDREVKPQVNVIEKSVDEPESQTGTPNKSVEQHPQISTMDKSDELQSQACTIDLSFENDKSHADKSHANKEMLQVNAADKCLAEPEPQIDFTEESSVVQVRTTSKPFAEKPQLNSTEKYSGDLPRPQSTTHRSSMEESIVNTTDKSSGETPSQTSTTDKCSSVKKLHMSITDKSFGGEKSQAHIIDKALGDPESQRSVTDETPAVTSKDTFLEKPESQTGTAEKSEQEPPTSTTEKSGDQEPPTSTTEKSGDQEPPTSTTEKSGDQEVPTSTTDKPGKQESPMCTTDKSYEQVSLIGNTEKSSGPAPPTSITDNSDEQKSPIGTTYKSSGQMPPTTITDYSGEQESPMGTTDKSGKKSQKTADNSSGKELPQVNSKDKSLDEPKSQTVTADQSEQELPTSTADKYSETAESTTDKSEQEPPTNTTDKSGKQESPMCTTDKSYEQVSLIGNTEKFSGPAPPTRITDNSDEQKSPIGTTYKSSGQVPPTTITDYSGEQESPMGTTDKSGEKSHDNSSGKEMPQENSKDKSLDEPKLQTVIADQSEQELPTSTADKYSEQEPAKSATDKSGNQKSQRSTTDHSSEQVSRVSTTESITKKQEMELDPTPYLRHRQGFQEGAAFQQPPKTVIEGKPATGYHWLIGPVVSAVVLFVLYFVFSSKGQPPVHQDSVLEIFFKEIARLKKDFPGQNEGLWFRSEKLLQKHLNMSDPSAPSILILTAAQDGEQTLHCVSHRLAKSYADSLSAKWLTVHGPSKSNFDSATSKMQIDEELSSGFQSGSRAAVLYRLETLPPGSLLILYKYCDHENAAFKNVALVLTILLDEQSLEMDLSFTEVEEKVKDFLWERFAYSGVSAHNEMDVDKLSGVWSRISHVVLPVLPVGSIESGSCPGI
ncbi:torsin-1A-interacting protein 2-like [Hyla sarda]|uniref:torsin-1A-interacting protein 2-like n=1 Tax=Hyla sarda TaxID=327740 RepID=UPI0024C308E9|nr:torsin-1A-interacting protein 2-like [Hyla sarda]XP_056387912.1 torsin-1A-interacting protein 2-like [Hyla sarda]XP_056387913.1 torsin-1A-interacting protein 2-like [Hyla sarda]XP_056387914.1 torsin-1A-interacting protein 2-like [Hyla sarda]